MNTIFRARHTRRYCKICETLLGPRHLLYHGFHIGYWEFRLQAKRGCPVCRFLEAGIFAVCGRDYFRRQGVSVPLYTFELSRPEGTEAIRVKVLDIDLSFFADVLPLSQRILLTGLKTVVFPSRRAQREYADRLASVFVADDKWRKALTDRLKQARRWLTECMRDHSCSSTARTFPKRLLRIEQSSGSLRLRLVDSFTDGVEILYSCLSYCWGGPQKMTLRTDTLDQLRTGIRADKLPKTISDAAFVIHTLGLKYMWVDSICIFQDSLKDWSHECNQMAAIYGDSVLTISATSSAVASDGFLDSFKPKGSDSFTPQDVTSFSMYARATVLHSEWSDIAPVERKYSKHTPPLYTRSWVLQEQMLSPRTLSFGLHEMTWECREHMQCECSLQQNMSQGAMSGKLRDKHELERLSQIDPEMSVPEVDIAERGIWHHADTPFLEANLKRTQDFQTFWNALILSYSQRKLSNMDDRLFALDGIVQKLRPAWGTCHKGHWMFDLIGSLLWCSKGAHAWKPERKRAPSWSWAALEHPQGVSLPKPTLQFGTTVSSVKLDQDELVFTTVVFKIKFLRPPSRWLHGRYDSGLTITVSRTGETGPVNDDNGDPLSNVVAEADRVSTVGNFVVCLRWNGYGGKFEGLLCHRIVNDSGVFYERTGLCSGKSGAGGIFERKMEEVRLI